MNPLSLIGMKGLGILLGVSVLANAGMGLYIRAVRAETQNAVRNLDDAVDANKSNIEAMTKLQASLTECVGKQQDVAALALAADAIQKAGTDAAAAIRLAQRKAAQAALSDPTCAANAEIAVCPGLIPIAEGVAQ